MYPSNHQFPSLEEARAALLAKIRTEFPDYDEVPDLIVKVWNVRLIECTAWHNDMCPSFIRTGTDGTICLFVDYLETNRRGDSWREANDTTYAPRFTVSDREAKGDQTAYHGDDLEKALAFILVPQGRADLCAAYEQAIGYDPAKDCPSITTEEISNNLCECLLDSLRE